MKTLHSCALALVIFMFYEKSTSFESDSTLRVMSNIVDVLDGLSSVLVVIVVSSLDSQSLLHRTYKVGMPIVLTVMYLYWWIEDTFYVEQYYVTIPTIQASVSLTSLMANGDRIMWIFFLKQSWKAFRNNDRCISICINPTIQWKESVACEFEL